MLTYQDLLEARSSGSEADVTSFIFSAINEHKNSDAYQFAKKAKLYYNGENPTIMNYERVLFDAAGKAYSDMFTANHKITSNFFGFSSDQEVGYLLGNGITFSNSENKKKLGKGFDKGIYDAALSAVICGKAFLFWNRDHVETFHFLDTGKRPGFAPLYDEESGALMAGVRYWQIAANKPLRCTLYEPDGYTEYSNKNEGKLEAIQPKRAYIVHETARALLNEREFVGENYSALPIIPLLNNDDEFSELHGKQNTIDALDVVTSGMVNNVDEGAIIYWVLTNCGGMDYKDADDFLRMVKQTHVAFMDNAENGARAEPHTIDVPVAATETAARELREKLFRDFQALDTGNDSVNAMTATAINFRYAALDLKCNKLEYQVTSALEKLFALVGIDDTPTYTRDKIINKQEEMQTLMMAAPYADDEYITTKALTIMGDQDQINEVMKRKASDDLGRFNGGSEAV